MTSIRMIILILSLIAVALVAGTASATPRLTLDESYFNFGYMPQYSRVSHTFWLKSTGDGELVINEIVPGCGCTQAPLEKDVIGVGDSASLEIIFDSRRFKNRVTKKPEIKSNGLEPVKYIQIIATVVEPGDTTHPLFFEPFSIDFFGTDEEVLKPIEFKMSNLSDSALNITVLDKADDHFTVELPSSIGPHETKTCKVTLKKEVAPQAFYKSFTIQVDDEWNHRFSVPVARKKADPPGVVTGQEIQGK